MQISTILVDRSIPRLRKVNEWWQDSAFVEGWGLYAERLGKDLGFYQDPYSEFGLLSGELWRASRLVVDSGLHYKHWTREQAIQYLNENTPSPEPTNVRAVDRYLAVPGQATSFMVGMRKFVAERERARQALGARFDLREYHAHGTRQRLHPPMGARSRRSTPGSVRNPPSPRPRPPRPRHPCRRTLLSTRCSSSTGSDTCGLESHARPVARRQLRHQDQFDDSLEDAWRTRMLAMLDKYLAGEPGVLRRIALRRTIRPASPCCASN